MEQQATTQKSKEEERNPQYGVDQRNTPDEIAQTFSPQAFVDFLVVNSSARDLDRQRKHERVAAKIESGIFSNDRSTKIAMAIVTVLIGIAVFYIILKSGGGGLLSGLFGGGSGGGSPSGPVSMIEPLIGG